MTRWPGLTVVDGPPLPGGAKDVSFAVDAAGAVDLLPEGPVPFEPATAGLWSPHTSDHVQGWCLVPTAHGWRFGHGDVVEDRAHGDVVSVGPWRLRLEGDAGVVVRSWRFRGRLLVRPFGWRRGCAWCMLAEDPRFIVVVDDVGFTRRPRASGVAVGAFAGRVDAAVARALADAAAGFALDGVDFDGGVVVHDDYRRRSANEHLQALTSGYGGAARKGPRASVDEVAAFVRSFAPEAWAREEQLREECAIAVAAAR